MWCLRAGRRGEPGQAMVEFALIGPLFLLLLFFIAEAALYVNALATVDYATREGARQAAICGSGVQPSSQSTVSATACQGAVATTVLSNFGILPHPTGANPTVQYGGPTPVGTPVTVSVAYTYDYYIAQFLGLGPTVSISSQATAVSQQ